MGELIVDFVGERWEVSSSLTFGRQADLQLDTDLHLHRVAGEFLLVDGYWWLVNRGSALFLKLTTAIGTRLDLAPGSRHALPAGPGTVSLRVGELTFEIDYEVPGVESVEMPAVVDNPGLSTSPFNAVLTPREVDFLVTFARPLLQGRSEPMPTYAEVAESWYVSPKTLDNTLQTLRRKLRNARLIRDEPVEEMVRVAVAHSLVTVADLRWASFDDGPRRAADGPRFRQE
jgi:hypothetical protein